jgi:FkbM family methyltransferase
MWFGYAIKKASVADKKTDCPEQRHPHESGIDIELEAFLNCVANIKNDCATLIELGAGRGTWSLILAGIIDNQLLETKAKTYKIIAVEAEPTHFQWCQEHFQEQNIAAKVIHTAIRNSSKEIYFKTGHVPAYNLSPSNWYGQSICGDNYPHEKTKVPSTTLDKLINKCKLDHVDIVHMDVQGAEASVIRGAEKAIKNKMIDYMVVSTHRRGSNLNLEIKELVQKNYRVILDIEPKSEAKTPIGRVVRDVDGLMLLVVKD